MKMKKATPKQTAIIKPILVALVSLTGFWFSYDAIAFILGETILNRLMYLTVLMLVYYKR